MKKIYIKPEIEIIETGVQSKILVDSENPWWVPPEEKPGCDTPWWCP